MVANLRFNCLESGVDGVQLDVGVLVLEGGLSIKLFARFKEESAVGHESVLMILHHCCLLLRFRYFKGWCN